jgi:acyl-CoA thioester hydrolase
MSLPTSPRTTTWRQAVRYLECDQQGVVFNMWYLGYLDEAFSALLAEGGLGYQEMVDRGVDVQLVHSEIDWVGPLRWGDVAEVAVGVERIGTTSITVGFSVTATGRAGHGGSVPEPRAVASGRTVYVAVGSDGSGARPVPDWLAAALGCSASQPPAPG